MSIWQNIWTTSVVMLVFIVAMLAIYYILTYRNLKQRRQHFEELHKNLKPGQKVELANGIRGTVRYVGDEECDIEIKSGAVMTVSRYAISHLVN
ncbi:preprotein translocase subunit YajC [Aerococcaceae bacterium NML160702]|nr:preprotein translocase subunit YajC [Aerococcaceae bacterium NML160702]